MMRTKSIPAGSKTRSETTPKTNTAPNQASNTEAGHALPAGDRLHAQGMNDALEIMRILSHPLRLSILCRLIEEKEMTAGEIVNAESGHASQSQVSQYLNQMRRQGLIKSHKRGPYVYYSLADKRAHALIAALHQLYCKVGQ